MSDVIREYLISLSYKIDTTTQKKFDATVAASDYNFSKLARTAALAGSAVFAAVTKISASLDTLYFTSQRTKASAENFTAFGYAASQVGAGADAAGASIESMASKLRRLPNMAQLMRNLGVRVTGDPTQDLVAMQRQLANKPMWLQLQYADMLGVEERVWLGLDKMGKFIDQRNRDAKTMGINYKEATENANKLWTSLRRLADVIYMIATKVQDNLFKAFGVDIDDITNAIVRNSKGIIDTVTNLFEVLTAISAAFALRMIASPFGALFAMITALMLLIDDYQVWAAGGKSYFKWDGFKKIKDQVDEIVKSLTGANGATVTWYETIGLVLATMLAMPLALRAVGAAVLGVRAISAGTLAAGAGAGGGILGLLFGAGAAAGLIEMLTKAKNQNTPTDGRRDRDSYPATFSDTVEALPSILGYIWNQVKERSGINSIHVHGGASWGSSKGFVGGDNIASDATGKGNAATATKIWRGLGWSEAQIAAGLSNLFHESNFNPNLHNTNGEDSYGAGQWSVDRRKRFAKWFGGPMEGSSFSDQVRFMDYELKHQESAVGNKFFDPANANNARDEGALLSKLYFRPSDKEGQAHARGADALNWLSNINSPKFQGSYDMSGYGDDGGGGSDTTNNFSFNTTINGVSSDPNAVAGAVVSAQQAMIDRALVRNGRPRVQ